MDSYNEVFTRTVTLSPKDLLNASVVPFIAAPALGPGKAYNVISAYSIYRAGTVAYVLGDPNSAFGFTSGSDFKMFDSLGMLDQSADRVVTGAPSNSGENKTVADNQPLMIVEVASAPLTMGNGLLTVVFTYSEIDLTRLD